MTESPIVIQNVYVMLAYAFRTINSDRTESIGQEDFEHLHDLLAEILLRGINRQVKRGLYRAFVGVSEELPTVRGQIDMAQTLTRSARTRGRIVCNFDEYLSDIPHNQALKAVIVLLIKHGNVKAERKRSLRRVLPYLEEVTYVSPSSIRWRDLDIHRANASYRLLLGVCELVTRGLIPTKDAGNSKLESWFSEETMSSLYERFLREYFAFHHPELSPAAPFVSWDFDKASASGAHQLPTMKTDLVLQKGVRTLIIDAKYYSNSMQLYRFGGKSTVHSGNLYQILSYVKNLDVEASGDVSGLLIYAQTTADIQPELDVVIQGNRIGALSLNLNTPWKELRDQLERIPEWLDG